MGAETAVLSPDIPTFGSVRTVDNSLPVSGGVMLAPEFATRTESEDELFLPPQTESKSTLCEDVRTQVQEFLVQLPPAAMKQVVERLLRRIADGEPLSARRVSDQVDESCEFVAELLEFLGGVDLAASVLESFRLAGVVLPVKTGSTLRSEVERHSSEDASVVEGTIDEGCALGFLASRRQYRLTPVRAEGPWEEHFTKDGVRYFYNNELQVTTWTAPAEWPDP
jgi:hypothetical protein